MNYKEYFSLHYHKIIGYTLLALYFVSCLFYMLPLTNHQIEKAQATIIQKSYYQLSVNGKPMLYFADYKDSTFLNGAYKADSIVKTEQFLTGYWINRLPFFPSCFGQIITSWQHRPSKILNYDNQKLHQLLFHFLIQVDSELGGLQTQNNELSYYLRIHNVQDYGYNSIAEYHEQILHKMDSLQNLKKVLFKINRKAQLRLYQINSYQLIRKGTSPTTYCNRTGVDPVSRTISLRTTDGLTPFTLFTRFSKSKAKEIINRNLKATTPSIPALPLGASYADSTGYYIGEIKKGKPNGYGQFFSKDGAYYSGHFVDGKRNGYGFQIAPHHYLLAGDWKDNIYKGERLTYSGERIYGIDLSRHQHEQNNKIYPISWDKLRITNLGTLSNKTVRGKVDYPISFIYIKSTEGCTVLNPYYAADYKAAREHGYRVGTYHFFSTTSAGADQADYFLHHSYYKEKDMPLVLDVEPSDAQIAKMGGAEALFKQVRAWMSRVYAKTGQRPILYISQMFANNYMPLAPDLGDNYLVWIARYGEYKPNIKLAYWQLSPDGKVHGVQGDVDINVFNGYRNKYEEFLKRHCR